MLGPQNYTQQNHQCLKGWDAYWKAVKTQSADTDQIPGQLIQAEYRRVCSKIHKLQITSIWNNKELSKQWKESIILPIYKKGNKTDCGNHWGTSLFTYIQNFIQHSSVKVTSICKVNCWGSSMCIWLQQINYWSPILHLPNTPEKMDTQLGSAWTICRLQESLRFSYDKGHRVGILMKLVRLKQMCCLDMRTFVTFFYYERSDTRRCIVVIAFQLWLRICPIWRLKQVKSVETVWHISAYGLHWLC